MTRLRIVLGVIAVCLGLLTALGACGGSDGSDGSDGSGGSGSKQDKVEARKFLNELDAAVREGNTDFRVARLNPAVIDRYGEQQCRDFLAGQQDDTRKDRVKRVGKPESFEYATDNQTATIADAIPVQVRATIKGKKGDRNLHVARVNDQLTYFIDCGSPLTRQ
jgi:hypothetical protein